MSWLFLEGECTGYQSFFLGISYFSDNATKYLFSVVTTTKVLVKQTFFFIKDDFVVFGIVIQFSKESFCFIFLACFQKLIISHRKGDLKKIMFSIEVTRIILAQCYMIICFWPFKKQPLFFIVLFDFHKWEICLWHNS